MPTMWNESEGRMETLHERYQREAGQESKESDIVDRLRGLRCFGPEHFTLLMDAADEITRLRAELAAIKGQEPVCQIRPDSENWIDCTAHYFDKWKGEKRKLYALPVAPVADKTPEQLGNCCYGGQKPKSACASCGAWKPAADKDAEWYRKTLIACRGSVKTDLNTYERMLIGQEDEARRSLIDAECNRLCELLEAIDAAMAKGE